MIPRWRHALGLHVALEWAGYTTGVFSMWVCAASGLPRPAVVRLRVLVGANQERGVA